MDSCLPLKLLSQTDVFPGELQKCLCTTGQADLSDMEVIKLSPPPRHEAAAAAQIGARPGGPAAGLRREVHHHGDSRLGKQTDSVYKPFPFPLLSRVMRASAMRLKHSVGPLTAVESRLNYCNSSNLQDSNSNEANFNDSAIWDTIRPVSILEESVAKCRPCPYGSQAGRLDNRRSGAARTAPRNISPGGNRNEPRDSNLAEDNCYLTRDYASRPTDNHRPPASTSSSTSSCYSSASSSCSASPLGSPASPIEGGIVNPNYPGFEHLAAKLLRLAAGSDYEDQDEDDEDNNNNIINENVNGKQLQYQDDGKRIDPINHDHADGNKALLYAKPKLAAAMADAFLSSAKEDLAVSRDFQKQAKLHKMSVHGPPIGALGALAARHYKKDSNRALEEREEEEEKYNREATEKELQQDIVVPRKKEKMAMNQQVRKARAGPPAMGFDRAERTERAEKRFSSHVHAHAHAHGQAASRREKRSSLELLGGFDVYNIETAMPRIDLDLIESHLRAAKEEERRGNFSYYCLYLVMFLSWAVRRRGSLARRRTAARPLTRATAMGMTTAPGAMGLMTEAMSAGPASLGHSLPTRRHYKKDTRFLLDLYHLTYDDHESLDTLDDLSTVGLLSSSRPVGDGSSRGEHCDAVQNTRVFEGVAVGRKVGWG
ncbi:hypothetical protein FOCC_FOCC002763 [Frankliniella occidentalis]|nr:hypothetical protein FOCC_FOCC002763 [Frankliniella occidentalis]